MSALTEQGKTTQVIRRAIEAHGDINAWNDVERLVVRFAIDGGLYAIKGFPLGLGEATIVVDPRRPRTRISPFLHPRNVGHFTPDHVWTMNGDGIVIDDLPSPRASFDGHHLGTPWNSAQLLYFTSYALWNYLTTPFVFDLPGFRFESAGEVEVDGERWDAVRVTWPADLPSHSDQTFYFDGNGLLKRIDYVTDVAGGVATHEVFDHRRFGGFLFPTLRRVVARRERAVIHGPTAVLLRLIDVIVE